MFIYFRHAVQCIFCRLTYSLRIPIKEEKRFTQTGLFLRNTCRSLHRQRAAEFWGYSPGDFATLCWRRGGRLTPPLLGAHSRGDEDCGSRFLDVCGVPYTSWIYGVFAGGKLCSLYTSIGKVLNKRHSAMRAKHQLFAIWMHLQVVHDSLNE